MDKYVYHRLAVQATMWGLLLYNLVDVVIFESYYLRKHPDMKIFFKKGPRYYTVWNAILQIVYCSIALTCEVSSVIKKDNETLKRLRELRLKIFHELVFPTGAPMFIFWVVYFYDRELILPIVTAPIMTPFINSLYHLWVILFVFWELTVLPSHGLKKESLSIKKSLYLQTAYIVVGLWTRFVDVGEWMYGILDYVEGPMFVVVFFILLTNSTLCFYSQWAIRYVLRKVSGVNPELKTKATSKAS